MKKKIILGIVIVLAIGIAIVSLNKKEEVVNNKKPTVKIGVIIPLTGAVSNVGQEIKKGIEKSLSDIQEDKYSYKVIFEDNASGSNNTKLAIDKLVYIDKVDVVISTWADSAKIINSVIKDKDILHFGYSWKTDVFKSPKHFYYCMENDKEIKMIVKYAHSKGYKRIGIIGTNISACEESALLIEQELKDNDIELVGKYMVNPGQMDFKMDITKIEEKQPDIYFVLLFDPSFSMFMKQLKELGVDTPITGMDILEDIDQSSFPLLNGQVISSMKKPNTFGEKRFVYIYGYDLIRFIKQAYENVSATYNKKPDFDKIVNYLNTKDLYSDFGVLRVQEDGRIPVPTTMLKYIHNNEIINKEYLGSYGVYE